MSTLNNDFDALERLARFHEGVSADPTSNMSPEVAAKWKAMNEEHGDKLKTAAGIFHDSVQKQVAYVAAKVAERGEQGVRVDTMPNDGVRELLKLKVVEAERGYLYPRNQRSTRSNGNGPVT